MTVKFIRVRDRSTGHLVTIPAVRFDSAAFERVDRPATREDGTPLPPKHRLPKGDPAPIVTPSGATRRRQRRTPKVPVVTTHPAETATPEEEN